MAKPPKETTTNGTALDTIKGQFPALVEKWKPVVARNGGPEWSILSEAETEVFQIHLDRYASMCAMHETWEAITDQCDMDSYDLDLLAAAREEAIWLNDEYNGGITGYLKLCSLLGVHHRDGYAMFYKVIFSDRRHALYTYDDEPHGNA